MDTSLDIAELNIVTGAFSYTGYYLAKELLKTSSPVRTITNHPRPQSDIYNQVEIVPYQFDDYDRLVESLEGGTTFFNTYWIRFPWGEMTWRKAIENSELLFNGCKDAGVKKIVHFSVTNPSLDSPYDYFRGKAEVERLIRQCGVPHTIIRPALIFEKDDVLLNNIAYLLRKLPVFGIFGTGHYRIQPIYQQDLAKIAVNHRHNGKNRESTIINAIGPETYTFEEMIKLIRRNTNSKCAVFRFPGISRSIPFIISKLLGWIKRDILLTWQEMEALRDDLLFVDDNPLGKSGFEEWIRKNGDLLGRDYVHELDRHYRKDNL